MWLTIASFVGWFVSTLAGGGSSLILLPLISIFLGTAAVAPVITTGMLFGNGQRVILYWQNICWEITRWYLPGAIFGATLGAFIFTRTEITWLNLLLAIFILASVVGYGFGDKNKSFTVRTWYFLPGGFFYAFLSGLIGSAGPLLTSFYLNYGLKKEELIATKATNILFVHIIKIIAYSMFGTWHSSYLIYGLVIGIAAFPGNWLGRIALQKVSENRFKQLVIVFIAFSGMLMLWQQRQFLLLW
ncbi:MAG: sulfite exporter TauE/SafE family protein [Spirulinaceae cyanobacterium]